MRAAAQAGSTHMGGIRDLDVHPRPHSSVSTGLGDRLARCLPSDLPPRSSPLGLEGKAGLGALNISCLFATPWPGGGKPGSWSAGASGLGPAGGSCSLQLVNES